MHGVGQLYHRAGQSYFRTEIFTDRDWNFPLEHNESVFLYPTFTFNQGDWDYD